MKEVYQEVDCTSYVNIRQKPSLAVMCSEQCAKGELVLVPLSCLIDTKPIADKISSEKAISVKCTVPNYKAIIMPMKLSLPENLDFS